MNDGSQPSASRPTRRSSDGAIPPSQTSSRPAAAAPGAPRSGSARRRARRRRRTSTPRITASASSNQRARSPRSTPNAWCSTGSATPSPNAGSRRPPDITASVASSLASTTGLRPGSTSTLMPNFEPRRAAGGVGHRDDRVGRLAADPLGEPQAVEPEPLDARRRRRRTPGPCSRVRVPSPTPMRTFIRPAGYAGSARRCAVVVPAGVPAEGEPDDHDRDHDGHRRHVGQIERRRRRGRRAR